MRTVTSLLEERKAITFVKTVDITQYRADPKDGDRNIRLKREPYSPCCMKTETQQAFPS